MSILQTHHIEFVEDRKHKQYWAICTCGWEEPFDDLVKAHMAAALHDLGLEEEEDGNISSTGRRTDSPSGNDDTSAGGLGAP